MPKYRSHKEVWAGEIEMISVGKESIVSFTDSLPMHFDNEEFRKMTDDEWIAKRNAEVAAKRRA